MKTRFKTLTEEPQYNLLKNINFRNSQNYIRTGNDLLNIKATLNIFEQSVYMKIFGILIINNAIIMILMLIYQINLSFLILLNTIIIAIVVSGKFTNYLIFKRRKKKYTLIKITPQKNYFLILNKIGGKIVKNIDDKIYENKKNYKL